MILLNLLIAAAFALQTCARYVDNYSQDQRFNLFYELEKAIHI